MKKLCETLYIELAENHLYEDAFVLAELCASLGYECGQADMGFMLYNGMGVEENKEKALSYLLGLSDAGNKEAQSYLKDLLEERGKGKK